MANIIRTTGQIAPILKQLRKAKGWSQLDLGNKIGLSQERISVIENHPERVSIDQLLTVLMALDAEIRIEPRNSLAKKVASDNTKNREPNRYLALIRSILKRAVNEWDWLGKAPMIKLFKEPEGRVRFLTPIEVQALLKELPPYLHDTVLFAFLTGLRQSNVLELEWSKVMLDKAHVWVDAHHAKGRKAIPVPLNGDALELLIKQKGKHPTRVFTNAGKPIGEVNNRVWRKALKLAGITDFRWHDSRHTWASHHVMNGTQPFELQKLGGWKSAKMVERYAHLSSEHLAGAAARLDSVFVTGYKMGTEV